MNHSSSAAPKNKHTHAIPKRDQYRFPWSRPSPAFRRRPIRPQDRARSPRGAAEQQRARQHKHQPQRREQAAGKNPSCPRPEANKEANRRTGSLERHTPPEWRRHAGGGKAQQKHRHARAEKADHRLPDRRRGGRALDAQGKVALKISAQLAAHCRRAPPRRPCRRGPRREEKKRQAPA